MIINLLGPPASAKSTFASRFILEHPYYKYCTIDAYRIDNYDPQLSGKDNEKIVWRKFYQDIYFAKDCLVESVGLDWRLGKIFEKISSRPRLNIAFIGDAQVIEKRLKERQHKRPIPFKYSFQDEIDTIYYVLDELYKDNKRYDHCVDTTVMTQEQVYEFVTAQITSFRIGHSG